MLITLLFLWMISSGVAMEIELQDYGVPPHAQDIQDFERPQLRGYIKYYREKKEQGKRYYNALLKVDYNTPENKREPRFHMLNFWYLDEIFCLEKKRRNKMFLMKYNLGDLLRNIDLIPTKIRRGIDFPLLSQADISLVPEIPEPVQKKRIKRPLSAEAQMPFKSFFDVDHERLEYIEK